MPSTYKPPSVFNVPCVTRQPALFLFIRFATPYCVCQIGVWDSVFESRQLLVRDILLMSSRDTAASKLDSQPDHNYLVFEQWWCVDRLLTATVYTKPTTGCPRWDYGASDTLILPYTFSLLLQPANRQSQSCMQLSVALTLDRLDWTGLTGRCHACCPPSARGVYSLAYMLQGR